MIVHNSGYLILAPFQLLMMTRMEPEMFHVKPSSVAGTAKRFFKAAIIGGTE
jgi:hypothetical protein